MPTYDPKDSKDVDVDGTQGRGRKSDSRLLFDALNDINGESSDIDGPNENEEEIGSAIVAYPVIADLLPDLIFSILKKVMGKLVEEKLQDSFSVISKGYKLNALYCSVLEIYKNEEQDYSARLAAMVKLIDRHSDVLPDEVVALKSWLGVYARAGKCRYSEKNSRDDRWARCMGVFHVSLYYSCKDVFRDSGWNDYKNSHAV